MSTEILNSSDAAVATAQVEPSHTKTSFGRSLAWLLAIAVTYFCAAFLYAIAAGIYYGVTQPELMQADGADFITAHIMSPNGLTGSYIVIFITVMLVLYKAASFPQQTWFKTLAMHKVAFRRYLPWLGLFAIYYALASLVSYIAEIDGGDFVASIQNTQHLGLFFIMVFLAPVVEELVFRGYFFQAWRNSWLGLWGTTIVTSVLFTLVHMGQYPMLVLGMLFCFSVLLGLAREKTGSVYVPMAMHAVNNFVACVLIVFLGIS